MATETEDGLTARPVNFYNQNINNRLPDLHPNIRAGMTINFKHQRARM